jgi:hypothetical protein
MQLISKETILSHLRRAEGAAEVTLPIDFFRDLLYQAVPQQRTWVGLTAEDRWEIIYATERDERTTVMEMVEAKLKEKNT